MPFNILPVRPGGNTSSRILPFQLINVSTTEPTVHKIRVVYSTLGGVKPTDFNLGDDPKFVLTVTGSQGIVWAKLVINTTTGAVTSRTVGFTSGATIPPNTNSDKYVEIGNYTIDDDTLVVVNARYGPIDVTICRNRFVAITDPTAWNVSFYSGVE